MPSRRVRSESEKTSIQKEIELHRIAKNKRSKSGAVTGLPRPLHSSWTRRERTKKNNFKTVSVFRLKHYITSSGSELRKTFRKFSATFSEGVYRTWYFEPKIANIKEIDLENSDCSCVFCRSAGTYRHRGRKSHGLLKCSNSWSQQNWEIIHWTFGVFRKTLHYLWLDRSWLFKTEQYLKLPCVVLCKIRYISVLV